MEWTVIPLSRGSYPGIKPGFPTSQADSLLSEPPGKPKATCKFVVILIKMSMVCSHKYKNPKICIGEGNGTPLQHSCLENPMDRGAWQAAVHGVAEGRT